ncbi:hypothetical protein PC9H_010304 [Pleurotus ostreatus]|uniref:Uncharacterized protein n=1 Tax=Pleurotus ostreatus TaxID=5322 RepID=A0A8H7DRF9_PLEOS|nr:uncharacterized protein PC9H_010304 [Pleurotus ostreatus]KAF7424993.1 hypothetical protein PC9H_010304 [Pleurotus ostreatus]
MAPPPPQSPATPLLAPPVSHLRPSLAELRGEKHPDSVTRTSLFMPHPNAPKPTVLSQGPMYIPYFPSSTVHCRAAVWFPKAKRARPSVRGRQFAVSANDRYPSPTSPRQRAWRTLEGVAHGDDVERNLGQRPDVIR